MGETKVELFKCVPHGWSVDRSFLICKCVTVELSYGKVINRYEVVERHSAQGYGCPWIVTQTLKGVDYTPNELSLIEKYHYQ